MKDLGNRIYSFGCVVAATVLGIGIADYWFGHHQMTAFLSWAVLAAIPWLIGRASLYVLGPSLKIRGRKLSLQTAN
jgi:hypothetical protein